ncbi:MAG: cysteine synthase family protein [bacterium]|nr:cysteine synthase family protein [bacterium]
MQLPTILDAIGSTPIVHAPRFSERVGANVWVKLEYLNPGLSMKDRIVKYIVEQGEREGKINKDTVLVEGSSGNTAASVAMIAAVKGLKARIVMPDKVSTEKIDTVRAYGAEVIITTTESDPNSPNYYPNVAKRIVEETPNGFYINQYHNPVNVDAHYHLTAPEIWEQCDGQIDLFVAGIGAGGTVTGIGRYLKEKKPDVHVLAIDVEGSIYTDWFYNDKIIEAHVYKVEGIGEDFIPPIVDKSVIDDMAIVGDRESFEMGRWLARNDGLLLGGSSGSAFAGLERFLKGEGRFNKVDSAKYKNIVVLAPDSGVKYLSKMYSDEWMKQQGLA